MIPQKKIVHLFFSIGAESPNGSFSVITKRHVHTFPHIGTHANEEPNPDLRKKETLWASHVRETKVQVILDVSVSLYKKLR